MDPNTTSQDPSSALQPNATFKQRYPIATWLVCAICIGVFLGLLQAPRAESWEALERWGYLPATRIYEGAYWALLTSVFVHLEFWHVGFNVYWIYILGAAFERVFGWQRFSAFFVVAALVSSTAQLAISGQTGIGASGVGYAIFGFLWSTQKQYPVFQTTLANRTVFWFLIWLVACVALSLTKVWEVGNAAHFAGLLFGAGVGVCVSYERYRRVSAIGLAVLCMISFVPLFWAPWSSEWTSAHALQNHRAGNFLNAIRWYKRSLDLGQEKTWCWENIALAYESLGDVTNYQQALRTLRTLNPKAADEIENKTNSQRR